MKYKHVTALLLITDINAFNYWISLYLKNKLDMMNTNFITIIIIFGLTCLTNPTSQAEKNHLHKMTKKQTFLLPFLSH